MLNLLKTIYIFHWIYVQSIIELQLCSMSFSVILKDSIDISSPDFKYWSGQSSSSSKGYQTVDPHQPTKTGPKRKLTRYEFFFYFSENSFSFNSISFGGYIWSFNINGNTNIHLHGCYAHTTFEMAI